MSVTKVTRRIVEPLARARPRTTIGPLLLERPDAAVVGPNLATGFRGSLWQGTGEPLFHADGVQFRSPAASVITMTWLGLRYGGLRRTIKFTLGHPEQHREGQYHEAHLHNTQPIHCV